ncbi:unnamed protein product [Blepharisma stoltei]|uniref:Glutathione S-transferase n=1 Tax=Blepharisma stoltei TaxID=1481888 RepID=A0AAU9ILM2_9CILI|nr:unnamed protein product [Blepharisma stoltei]
MLEGIHYNFIIIKMTTNPERIQLIIHYLCPYAQRALYALAYKGIQCEITEADLVDKPSFLLEVNPLGKVPSLKVIQDGREYHLYESINVAEYFDSFPGPALYPRRPDGSINPVEKALIDINVKLVADALPATLFPHFKTTGTPEQIEAVKKILRTINGLVEGGGYLMTKTLGRNELTFADIILLPFVERIVAWKDQFWSPLVEGEDFSNLWAWFDRIMQEPWAQRFRVEHRRLINNMTQLRTPGYKGLTLPITNYD